MTFHAPEERLDQESIAQQHAIMAALPFVQQIMNAMPLAVAVLNVQRQIVHSNQAMLETLGASSIIQILGQRPGEAIKCIHRNDSTGGCGTGEACRYCGAVNAFLQAQRGDTSAVQELRLTVDVPDGLSSLDLDVQVRPFHLENSLFYIVTLKDISGEKRRRILERMFFHDIINSAGGLKGLADITADSPDSLEVRDLVREIQSVSASLLDEILAQRELNEAESGELSPRLETVRLSDVVAQAVKVLTHHDVAQDRIIQVHDLPDSLVCVADPALIRRILINMIKNALEAIKPGDSVDVYGLEDPDGTAGPILWVHNSGFMSREVQLQLFQRSFSTKGSNREIGTYSMKLLAERYLGGRLWFESSSEAGTAFKVQLPKL